MNWKQAYLRGYICASDDHLFPSEPVCINKVSIPVRAWSPTNLTPNFQYLAVVTNELNIEVWDIFNLQRVFSYPGKGITDELAESPAPQLLKLDVDQSAPHLIAIESPNNVVKVIDIQSNQLEFEFKHNDATNEAQGFHVASVVIGYGYLVVQYLSSERIVEDTGEAFELYRWFVFCRDSFSGTWSKLAQRQEPLGTIGNMGFHPCVIMPRYDVANPSTDTLGPPPANLILHLYDSRAPDDAAVIHPAYAMSPRGVATEPSWILKRELDRIYPHRCGSIITEHCVTLQALEPSKIIYNIHT